MEPIELAILHVIPCSALVAVQLATAPINRQHRVPLAVRNEQAQLLLLSGGCHESRAGFPQSSKLAVAKAQWTLDGIVLRACANFF